MELILTIGIFALVTLYTPGPNNLMLMASGANFGMRRSVPHILGVALGFCFMLFLVGIGVIKIFDLFPVAYDILKWVSIAYLLYLAYKIATVFTPTESDQQRKKPMTFFQAVAFQWVNPKAWTMCISAVTVYAPDRNLSSILLMTLIFAVIGLSSSGAWTLMGQRISLFLTSAVKRRVFNYTMAGLLLLSLYPVVMG